jgi:hypothetical protein
MSSSDVNNLCHSGSFTSAVSPPENDQSPEVFMPKSRSGHESSDLKITSGAFSTIDLIQWKDSIRNSAHDMSSSDVSKLRHSGSFTSGLLPLALAQGLEVLNVEVPKRTQNIRYKYHFRIILDHRSTTVEG